MSNSRATSLASRLARAGCQDAVAGADLIATWKLPIVSRHDSLDALLEMLGSAADPDWALATLTQLPDQVRALALSSPHLLLAVVSVAGASAALGDHMVRHPDQISTLVATTRDAAPAGEYRQQLLAAVGAEASVDAPIAGGFDDEELDALRVAYRKALLGIAVRDLVFGVPLEQTAAELSDLADAALEAGLAIARAELPEDASACRFSVIALGKCGARELNYISDVDVIFVAEPVDDSTDEEALRTATRLATGLIRACGTRTQEGSLWQVDAALRPEGKAGALVRTLASHRGYYERWATTWEFQALLKARFAAGDQALGAAYVDAMSEFVWTAADRDGFVADVQRMRKRVEEHIPSRDAERQLKLGRGGLRDVEFSVQLLQLVHGRSDVMLRAPSTLSALEALATWGYIGREDGAVLSSAYRFLRSMEHRIQLQGLRRTHLVPDNAQDIRRLGRSLGFRGDVEAELTKAWTGHAHEVRRIHEKLFYRPLLQAVARLDAGSARLSVDAAGARLQALGYRDPQGALRHIEALTSGVSRRAAIQRTLLPVLLGWFADGPDPDGALLGFRQMSEELGSTPWFLRLLRDESITGQRMATLLSSSRYAADLLLRSPDALSILSDDTELVPRSLSHINQELDAVVDRHESVEAAVAFVRAVRRRELFRIAAGYVLGVADLNATMQGLTDVTAASLRATLRATIQAAERVSGQPFPTRVAIIAVGRFGGAELGFGSDADVLFVHDPLPSASDKEAADAAARVINEMRQLLTVPSPDPALVVDADLRPEGRQGPLVRTLASYRAYYERWSSPWEAQALLRARAIAGDDALGREFEQIIDPLRWPADGISDVALTSMRTLKARMESERLPRGADPTLHTKLGRGGLSDVEWVAQLLQLRHAAMIPQMQTTSTQVVLQVAQDHSLLASDDARTLMQAWVLATSVRNAIVLARGRSSDVVPSGLPDLPAVAHLLGYAPGQGSQMLEDYRRTTRRARAVMERLFYS